MMIPIKIQLITDEENFSYRGYLKENIDMRIIEYLDENQDTVKIYVEKDNITIIRKTSRMKFQTDYVDNFQYATEYGEIYMKLLTNSIETGEDSFLIDYCLFDEEDNLIFTNKMEIKYIKEQ